MYLPVVCLVLLSHSKLTTGYGTGSPTSRCDSMTPGHGSESTNSNPYSLSVSASEYNPGGSVTVTVNGASFQGILLEARTTGTSTIVGAFSNFPSNTKGIDCTNTNGAVTHSSTASKTQGTSFTWTAPSDLTGDIEFVATVAEAKMVWWKNVKSSAISRSSSSGNQESTTQANSGEENDSPGSVTTSVSSVTEAGTTSGAGDKPNPSESDEASRLNRNTCLQLCLLLTAYILLWQW